MTDGVDVSAEAAEMLADSLDSNGFWRSARVVRALLAERDTLRQQLHDAGEKMDAYELVIKETTNLAWCSALDEAVDAWNEAVAAYKAERTQNDRAL